MRRATSTSAPSPAASPYARLTASNRPKPTSIAWTGAARAAPGMSARQRSRQRSTARGVGQAGQRVAGTVGEMRASSPCARALAQVHAARCLAAARVAKWDSAP